MFARLAEPPERRNLVARVRPALKGSGDALGETSRKRAAEPNSSQVWCMRFTSAGKVRLIHLSRHRH